MPSIEALMEMLATMILFVLIATIILQALLVAKGDEISFGHAYPMTQKIVYMINAISAGPQNESATLKISTFGYKIDFDEDNNYVECETNLFGNAKYGLFVFKDIELVAEDIDCISENCLEPKTLLFQKEVVDGQVRITVSETEETSTTTTTVGPCGALPCLDPGICRGNGGNCVGGCEIDKCCCQGLT